MRKGDGVVSLGDEHPLLVKKMERTNCFPSEAERHHRWLMSSFKCWCFCQLSLADGERSASKADIHGTRAFPVGKLGGCQKMITCSANKHTLCPRVASQKREEKGNFLGIKQMCLDNSLRCIFPSLRSLSLIRSSVHSDFSPWSFCLNPTGNSVLASY